MWRVSNHEAPNEELVRVAIWINDAKEDRVAEGVIDPTMVRRTALQNAAPIAALLLTTEALISEIKVDQKVSAMPQRGGMGDMY